MYNPKTKGEVKVRIVKCDLIRDVKHIMPMVLRIKIN